MVRMLTAWTSLFVLLIGCTNLAGAQELSGKALVTALKGGGYVLLMHHASSPHQPPAETDAAPGNTDLERQLDATGIHSAQTMGLAIRTLGIPIGEVLSSPTFRARQTIASAGLGMPEIRLQLGDGGKSMSPEAVGAWAYWLREAVAQPPRAGTNTVMVTHSPNIASAFPDAAKGLTDGEALVFHPDGKGGAELVAHIRIEDWPGLATSR